MSDKIIQKRSFLAGGLVLVAVFGLLAPQAAAAATTTVEVMPADSTIPVGETTTATVVVTQADGGVGAWEGTLNLTDGTAAEITDVTLHGNPELTNINVPEDGDSAYFRAALAETNQSGSVTVVSVTLRGTADGVTGLRLSMVALGDEVGNSYTISAIQDGSLTVGDGTETSGHTESTQTSTSTASDGSSQNGSTEHSGQASDADPPSTETTTMNGPPSATETMEIESTDTTTPAGSSTATATVESKQTLTQSTPAEGTGAEAPGFGAVTAVLVLIGIGLGAARAIQ